MERKYFALVILSLCCLLLSCGGGNPWDNLDLAMLWGLAADDLNGDGKPDIAVATEYVENAPKGYEDSYTTVLLNNTNSPIDFFPAEQYWLIRYASSISIAIGDLNGDGYPDIVTEAGALIFILFQDSTSPGYFLSPISIGVGRDIRYLSVGDLNEDNFNDIAIAGFNGPHLSILFQDSKDPGNFLPLVSIGIPCSSVAIGDLNGDSINDMAVTGGGFVKILFQDPVAPGTFFIPVTLTAGIGPKDVKIGDIDKDGSQDLVIGNGGSTEWFDGSISILLQDSITPGEFLPTTNYLISCEVREISLGDLNDDGFLDIAVASWCSGGFITILFQDISSIGKFLSPTRYASTDTPWSIAVDDMNGDNLNDLIISDDVVVVRLQDASNPGAFLEGILVFNPY